MKDSEQRPFELSFGASSQTHKCVSYRKGDWIIFQCAHPGCDYEMRDNFRTGEWTIRNAKRNIHHQGSYFPDEYRESYENVN